MAKNSILRFPGGSLKIVDGGLYRDGSGTLKEYDGGVQLPVNKSGKMSYADFISMLKTLQDPKSKPFLDEVEKKAEAF